MDKYINAGTYPTHSDMVAEALKQLIERKEADEPKTNQDAENQTDANNFESKPRTAKQFKMLEDSGHEVTTSADARKG